MDFNEQREFISSTLPDLKLGIDEGMGIDENRIPTISELADSLAGFMADTCEGYYIDKQGTFKYDSYAEVRSRSERIMNDLVLGGVEAFSEQFYNLSAIFMSREFRITKFNI